MKERGKRGEVGQGTQAGAGYNSCWTYGSRDHLRRDYPRGTQEGQAPIASNPIVCFGCGSAGHQRQDCSLVVGGRQAKAPTAAP
ncbi:hypothetical protein V6N12_009217 [Hibiscus sabdariffa]|uniref:CCHC-type domain-containing protein n=1 Tax=Hibiscus sabdariffa TaxID=183260 RepID=A0ABR2BIW8_9ROSI